MSEHAHLAGRKSVALTPASVKKYDCVLIVTDHDSVDYGMVGKHAKLVVDSRNAMARVGKPQARVVKA